MKAHERPVDTVPGDGPKVTVNRKFRALFSQRPITGRRTFMKQLVLATGLVLLTGSMLLSGTARADSDRERQQESNQNRRERQADAINKMDDDNKKEAVEKAHERNQDVRERQKDGNKERRGRD
jgi:hypothetical protein